MRGDSTFGDPVHFGRSNLYFDSLMARTDDRRMKRLIHIGFGSAI